MNDNNDVISKLKTPKDCEQFAINVERKRGKNDLSRAARRKGIELAARAYNPRNAAERESIEALLAYEHGLSRIAGKKTRASRTWQMIKKHGVVQTVEKLVKRPRSTTGYAALVEMGMEDKAFEAVVLRYPEEFSSDAVKQSRMRLDGALLN